MKKILFFLTFISLFSCNENSSKSTKDSYEKKKESVEEIEFKNPKRFLEVTSTDRKNLIGQRVIKGIIKNIATICWYKDVELKISFFSKTNVLLEENKEIIYEVIQPGNEHKFKTKFFTPKGTDNVTIEITNATPVPKNER